MEMDFNDYDWDVYLVNDCMFVDFEIIQVECGGRVRLWIINGVVVIVFWIDMGIVVGWLVVVDGYDIWLFVGICFGVVMG